MPEVRIDYRVYVFYRRDVDIPAMEDSELEREIMDFVYTILERIRREYRDDLAVEFEFDSDENVKRTYGSYQGRLR